MRGTGIHHLDLVVSSVERSLPFYRELLEPLGYDRVGEVVGGEYDRYRVGVHHVAFEVASRDVVDERHRWVVEQPVSIESPPKEYEYTPGYYAFFFYDPDGIKLEIVHVPDRAAA
jgi:glyoxylase I family protein